MNKGSMMIGVIVVGILILYIPLSFWLFPYLHDRTLDAFSKSLTSISLPTDTFVVDRLSKIGLQTGNSNHCDYFSGIMLKTSLPRVQFENYYRSHYSGDSNVRFLWLDKKPLDIPEIFTLRDWIAEKQLTLSPNVIVFLFEGAMTSALDYRCT